MTCSRPVTIPRASETNVRDGKTVQEVKCLPWKQSSITRTQVTKKKINQFSRDPVKCKDPSPPEKLMILNGFGRWVSFSLKIQPLRKLGGRSKGSEGKEGEI